jgi:long-chain acyl-CoA synthetase
LQEQKDYVVWDAMLEDGKAILEKSPLLVKDVEARIDENDTVNICYTSGTTEIPRESCLPI